MESGLKSLSEPFFLVCFLNSVTTSNWEDLCSASTQKIAPKTSSNIKRPSTFYRLPLPGTFLLSVSSLHNGSHFFKNKRKWWIRSVGWFNILFLKTRSWWVNHKLQQMLPRKKTKNLLRESLLWNRITSMNCWVDRGIPPEFKTSLMTHHGYWAMLHCIWSALFSCPHNLLFFSPC